MKIPFDIKYRPQIESGEYTLETRDGRPVRIICWDCNNYNPIIALADKTEMWNGDKNEYIISCCIDGRYTPNCESQDDLFIITPEEELTDFEQEVSDIVEYCKKNGENVVKGYAKRHAKTLLYFAEKELSAKYKVSSDLNGFAYGKGYEDGKKEALNDLPKWKKVGLDTGQTTLMIGYTGDEDKLYRNGYVISLTDLDKLPKEEEK